MPVRVTTEKDSGLLTTTLSDIARHIQETGHGPQLKDIAEWYLISIAGARWRVVRLKDLGLVVYEPGQLMTLRLTAAGRRALG